MNSKELNDDIWTKKTTEKMAISSNPPVDETKISWRQRRI
jgi:hypothetical protein